MSHANPAPASSAPAGPPRSFVETIRDLFAAMPTLPIEPSTVSCRADSPQHARYLVQLVEWAQRARTVVETALRGAPAGQAPEVSDEIAIWRQALEDTRQENLRFRDAYAELKTQHNRATDELSRLRSQLDAVTGERASPRSDWHEDDGSVLWWWFDETGRISEPPYCGTPLDADFPEYVTHFTRIAVPQYAAEGREPPSSAEQEPT